MVGRGIYEFSTDPKVVKISTIIAFCVVFLALIIGYIIAVFLGTTNYNMMDNYISDMGNSEHTPFPFMRSIGNIISGPFFIPLTLYIRKQFSNQIQQNDEKSPQSINIGLIGMLLIFIGMMMTGIITLDVNPIVHSTIAIITILAGCIATISYGFTILRYQTTLSKIIGIYMVSILPIIVVLFTTGFPSYVFYEWVILFSLYGWMILISIQLLRKNNI